MKYQAVMIHKDGEEARGEEHLFDTLQEAQDDINAYKERVASDPLAQLLLSLESSELEDHVTFRIEDHVTFRIDEVEEGGEEE